MQWHLPMELQVVRYYATDRSNHSNRCKRIRAPKDKSKYAASKLPTWYSQYAKLQPMVSRTIKELRQLNHWGSSKRKNGRLYFIFTFSTIWNWILNLLALSIYYWIHLIYVLSVHLFFKLSCECQNFEDICPHVPSIFRLSILDVKHYVCFHAPSFLTCTFCGSLIIIL